MLLVKCKEQRATTWRECYGHTYKMAALVKKALLPEDKGKIGQSLILFFKKTCRSLLGIK